MIFFAYTSLVGKNFEFGSKLRRVFAIKPSFTELDSLREYTELIKSIHVLTKKNSFENALIFVELQG